MTELEELTDDKTLQQLKDELYFQIHKQGENEGGQICSHIKWSIICLENALKKQ